MAQSATIGPLEPQKAPAYFNDALCDAERLLKYAAEIGIDVTADTRGAILRARTASTEGWPDQTAADLLAALTSLAARLKPVTAESLKAYHDDTRPTVHNYLIWAIILACLIVPASIATFVTSAISKALRDDLTIVGHPIAMANATPAVIESPSAMMRSPSHRRSSSPVLYRQERPSIGSTAPVAFDIIWLPGRRLVSCHGF